MFTREDFEELFQENKKLEEELENTKKTYSLMAAAKKETEEAYLDLLKNSKKEDE